MDSCDEFVDFFMVSKRKIKEMKFIKGTVVEVFLSKQWIKCRLMAKKTLENFFDVGRLEEEIKNIFIVNYLTGDREKKNFVVGIKFSLMLR